MNDTNVTTWLEVTLTVDGELAEAVADVLARYAPNGVVTEQAVAHSDSQDTGEVSGSVIVRAYLEMDSKVEETRRKLEESLYYLGMIQPVPAPEYRELADQNWMEAWKQRYQPIPIGQRLLILPIWMDSPEPERIPVKIDPGMAFGTGTHPSTHLCLELIESLFIEPVSHFDAHGLTSETRFPSSIIDIGCGSGILSIAALKLGAQVALGVDLDQESVKNARRNAEHNGVEEQFIVDQGSVRDVLEDRFPLRQAQLVAVNILAPTILALIQMGLVDLVEPGGALVLSGILQTQDPSVFEAIQTQGLFLRKRKQMGDWVAVSLVKREAKLA